MTAFASARERNRSNDRHSSRNLPLKLSPKPFCQGLPGSINAVSMPFATIHLSSARLTNSGAVVGTKIERRTTFGHEPRQHLDHAMRPNAAIDLDGSFVHSSVTVRHFNC